MKEMIEIVFDAVPDSTFDHLADMLIEGKVSGVYHSEEGDIDDDAIDGRYLDFLKGMKTSPVLFIRVTEIQMGRVSIRQPLVRLLRVDDTNELSIDFYADDVIASHGVEVTSEMAERCAVLAEVLGVKAFFCGLEPASDKETQIFSDHGFGPMKYP